LFGATRLHSNENDVLETGRQAQSRISAVVSHPVFSLYNMNFYNN